MNKYKTLIIIAGPTAVGKTRLSIELAQHFDTEILSADSRQFYRDLKIGTASPTDFELSQAKHHFIGNLALDEYYNVSIYEQQALKIIDELFKSKDYVVVVGGSGLYINALCHGIDELPDADDELRESIKKQYAEKGLEYLQQEVEKLDPEFYSICDTKNPKRLMRALEVCLSTGLKYSSLRTNQKVNRNFNIIKLALNLPREILYHRINERVDNMLELGLENEVRNLIPQKHLNALNTVGYKELFKYFDHEISFEQAITDIKTNSRRYAKRQITWFKKDEEFIWTEPNLASALEIINNKMHTIG